ncbi:unnamed protein product [Nesidiocoris tenuis]|uniref:Uncharacterized protein n=1 Tax=Nesidiocoris tenuis TaxID=355587 RepID=A0A6H5GA48_9HEMI|nr:unnamed protein product [Nesidiocoris tenuis]
MLQRRNPKAAEAARRRKGKNLNRPASLVAVENPLPKERHTPLSHLEVPNPKPFRNLKSTGKQCVMTLLTSLDGRICCSMLIKRATWKQPEKLMMHSSGSTLTAMGTGGSTLSMKEAKGTSQSVKSFSKFVQDNQPNKILSVDEFLELRAEAVQKIKEKGLPNADPTVAPPPGDDLVEEEPNPAIKRPYFHVKPLETAQLNTWRDYLDFEISTGDVKRAVILFERCLIACAMTGSDDSRSKVKNENHGPPQSSMNSGSPGYTNANYTNNYQGGGQAYGGGNSGQYSSQASYNATGNQYGPDQNSSNYQNWNYSQSNYNNTNQSWGGYNYYS